ncbi:endothelial lipase-like [Spodoptera frugiperda]|uniref:Endothelial lipase-like n=1 Tax=Spodoptera frugiperda TaxID=7108 RepID=A0A9R0EH66_SPOFR|nr:endothelial lipase-like [Spodoptera frugiperda]
MLKLVIILTAIAVCYGVQEDVMYNLFRKDDYVTYLEGHGDIPHTFNATDKTIFLIHGYVRGLDWRFNELITTAIFDYRNRNNYNVITVYWKMAAGNSYIEASASVHRVAENLANLIRWLTHAGVEGPNVGNVANVEDFHLVGFGLGAHVAGIAGRLLQDESKVVGRITGLDPTRRLWDENSDRLRRGDASYVEVIYTDTLGLLPRGIREPIGDINFYANGGWNQPGCLTHSCNHERAYELFAASMINSNLAGRGCTSNIQMNLNICRGNFLELGGFKLSKSGLSIYRIDTISSRYPFLY